MSTHQSRIMKITLDCFLIGLFIVFITGAVEATPFYEKDCEGMQQSRTAAPTLLTLIAMGSGSSGTIAGTVTFVGVPCGPGMASRVPPCNGPYPKFNIVVYRADGKTIETRAVSDKDGNYRISLPPGNYIIYTPAGPIRKKPNTVTIVSGEITRLDLVIDTGMRSDVPPGSSINMDTKPFNTDSKEQ